jgi:electron transport complex protein RnfC
VRHLLNDAGFCASAEPMVIMGGPLMGFTLPWLDVPVVKITNCLLAPSASEMGEPQEEKGCIRCSACADACPADLLPQQLYWFSKGQQHDKATAHNLADCIECGACAWVCPSNIPLVQYFRQEKAEIAAIRQEEQRAAEAKARFEARQARLEREKAARAERHKKAAVQPAAKDQDAINAALARVRDKQRDAAQPIVIQAGAKPDNSEAIAAREARKAEARARKAQQQAAPVEAPSPTGRSAQGGGGSRYRPRQSAQSRTAGRAGGSPGAEPVDPRKAAVEAAIARAKARKAEQQAAPVEAPAAEPVDPRKRRWKPLSPAPKRVKPNSRPRRWKPRPAEPVDPRKAAVEAAIARAKARKAEQQAAPVEAPASRAGRPAQGRGGSRHRPRQSAQSRTAGRTTDLASAAANDDPRKAAVAAAIARVQARKATQQAVNEE